MGDSAFRTFREYFLSPELESEDFLKDKFQELVSIDNFGIFVPIFIHELNRLGASISDSEDLRDKTGSIEELLGFLLTIARRKEHELVPLEFNNKDFRLAIMLMAQSKKAETQGFVPYVNRINKDFALGVVSVYVVGFRKARKFMKELIGVLDSEIRYVCSGIITIKTTSSEYGESLLYLSEVQKNNVVSAEHFADVIEEHGIDIGSVVPGAVLDVSQDYCLIDVFGLSAVIPCSEIDWIERSSCKDVLKVGDTYKFVVTDMNAKFSDMRLTRRIPGEDPWLTAKIPKVGDKIDLELVNCSSQVLIGVSANGQEVRIPIEQATWGSKIEFEPASFLGTRNYEAVVIELNTEDQYIVASIIKLTKDPWPHIVSTYTKGREVSGKVHKVIGGQVIVDLGSGVHGFVPEISFRKAGHEYANYRDNLVVGQVLDLIVVNTNKTKRNIVLDLARNREL
ncbi:MAG: hypothetical protein PsegKO_36240 [Pseudohongiellaceae bacterium]